MSDTNDKPNSNIGDNGGGNETKATNTDTDTTPTSRSPTLSLADRNRLNELVKRTQKFTNTCVLILALSAVLLGLVARELSTVLADEGSSSTNNNNVIGLGVLGLFGLFLMVVMFLATQNAYWGVGYSRKIDPDHRAFDIEVARKGLDAEQRLEQERKGKKERTDR